MAERRMFAKTIVLSDEFLDMPTSTRCLYFTLGMFADDDGFVNNPKSIIRQIGASLDDINVLVAKKFVIAFDDGVIVIKHWRINNLLRADRHQQTKYIEKLNELFIDEKGAYTQNQEKAVKKLGEKKTELKEINEMNPTSYAREKRKEARKHSDLPYSFDYKIRQAFHLKNCPICNCKMDMNDFMLKPTIQHNVPISLGGKHELDNISVICKSCNTSIQNRHITESLNNEEVKKVWERICMVANPDTENSIGKDSIDKDSIDKNSIENKEIINKQTYKEDVTDCDLIFKNMMQTLAQIVPAIMFQTFFAGIKHNGERDGKLVLIASSEITKNAIEERYHLKIIEAIVNSCNGEIDGYIWG